MRKLEPTWTLSVSTQDYSEYTTSRACWETTTYGPDHKKRSQILAQFVAASFVIAEIMKGWLTGNKLSWRRTKSKLVAYVSNLLGSTNVRFILLGEGMKEVLNIAGSYLTN